MFESLLAVAKTAQSERSKRLENGWSEKSISRYMAGFENGLTDTWLKLLNNGLLTDEQYEQLIDVLDKEC